MLSSLQRLRPVLALFLLPVLACSGGNDKGDPDEVLAFGEPPFIEAGDLSQIRESNKLRILYPRRQLTPGLPRKGDSIDFELELAESYAETQGLEPIRIYVEAREELIPALLAGRGDLVVGNLTATAERREHVGFTVPITVVREQVVTRIDDAPMHHVADLVGRRVAVRKSSSFRRTIEEIRSRHPGIEVEEVLENLDTEEIVHRVASGQFDVTVADSNLISSILSYRDDVKVAFDVSGDRAVAWAVRPNSPELRASLDRYLTRAQLTARDNTPRLGDLADIKQRKVLRVLTRNSAATYFLWHGELMGFEYELAGSFAGRNGVRLEMIVPPAGTDLLDWLREGHGDLVAAALTPTEERLNSGVDFSRPYNFVLQTVVARAYESDLTGIDDLEGRTFHVRRNSSYWVTLKRLQDSGVALELVEAPEEEETEEIIAKVADNQYDLTLADSNILDIELTWRDDVAAAFVIGEPVAQTWAVRDSSPELLEAVNAFISSEYRGLFYNVVYDKYFRNPGKIKKHLEDRYAKTGGLSPYDPIVRRYAEQYDFDWRLIVSQMYQESRFDPSAVSFAGAIGLMQVLPRTGRQLGFEDVEDPENGIHAGVKYLDWVRDRFEPELQVTDRMWFTLAGYNAGPGHVRDARRLARQQGLDPNRWFGNVEDAMLLLSRRQYAQEAAHGYCRCREPVKYVREIRSRYGAYVDQITDKL